jgi:hypothetical protein
VAKEAGALTVDTMHYLLHDEAFVVTIRQGVQPDAAAALAEFWNGTEFAGLARELELPQGTWPVIARGLERLLKRNAIGDQHVWTRVAQASERLAATSPVAGSIVSLYALARWEGALGGDLLREALYKGNYQLAPGWDTFPLAVARNLDKAGAIFASSFLSQRAVESIETSPSWAGNGRNPAVTAGYRTVFRHAQRRYAECIENLASDLRHSCEAGIPNCRAEVAAMFWSLGDVPHAELLQQTTLLPSRQVAAGLVHRSMQAIPFDPALQQVWLGLKERCPFDVSPHKELFRLVSLHWGDLPRRRMPGRDLGQHRVEAISFSDPTPSRAYAAAVTEYFGAGLTPKTLAQLSEAHTYGSEFMATWAPEALIRLRSLLTLASPEARPPHVPPGSERWKQLAQAACSTVRAREQQSRDSYDGVLDIPFYYLDRETQSGLTTAVELTERYRQAGTWFRRLVIPAEGSATDPDIQELVSRAHELIAELHARRYLSMIPYLPARAARLEVSSDDYLKQRPSVDDLARTAPDRVRELAAELEDVREKIGLADPEFAAARRAADAPIEDFAARLLAEVPRAVS